MKKETTRPPSSLKISETESSLTLHMGDCKLTVQNTDLLDVSADALVCPVDQLMNFNSGLASVVARAAGKQFKTERPSFPEPYGKVIVLPGGKLRVKYVFLSVLLGERGLDKMRFSIHQAVNRTIRYAEFLRLKSIAFPVLGDAKLAPSYSFIAHEMMTHVQQYFNRRNTKLKAILVSAYNAEAFKALKKEAQNISEF